MRQAFVDRQVKLADFGHSKVVSDGFFRTPSNVGTPLFMAPEAFTEQVPSAWATAGRFLVFEWDL